MAMVLVKLITSDGVDITIERTKIRKSGMIIATLNDLALTDNPDATPDELYKIRETYENKEPIHLKLVSKASFDNVMEWCEQHAQETEHIEIDPATELPAWDTDFLQKLNNRAVLEMLISANFLDIPVLRLFIAMKIRDKVRGVGPEDIRRVFAK